MDAQIINKIINSLNNNLENKGTHAQFNNPDYKPKKIDKTNFHEIKNTDSNQKIAFIDGGNTELLKAPNFSLQLIRIHYTIYQQNKRIDSKKQQFYILINAKNQDNNIIYKTEFFGTKKDPIQFDSFDNTIKQGQHRISISEIGNAIRRFLELGAAKDLTNQLNNNDIIVIDGDLKATISNEIIYFNELYQKAIEKNIIVASISKTSELFTETGNALIPILNEIAPKEAWYYYPLVKIESENHKADLYILKLNKSSNYIFKFEIFNKTKYDINEILAILKENSKDPVFLGYPYGLIEADQSARISNKEKGYLKTIFITKLGKNNQKIAQYLNTLNAHNMLDSISY